MGFGVVNLLSKYVRPALITWNTYNGIAAGSINVDVRVSETHKLSNDVTQQTMENGSVISEHVINNPVELSLQFTETNNTSIVNGALASLSNFNFLSNTKLGPMSTFEKLTKLAEKKVPLTITTQHKIYNNMVIKNMPIMHRAPYRNSLQVACDLKQLNFSKPSFFTYVANELGISKAITPNENGGFQLTSTFGG